MQLLEFIAKYPRLLNHPNLKIENDFAVFRHELCHFVEREIEKAFLYNFGFSESLGEDLHDYSDKYFWEFAKRETRVMLLETMVPFQTESSDRIYFSEDSIRMLNNKRMVKPLGIYKSELSEKYNRDYWWYMFNAKYERL